MHLRWRLSDIDALRAPDLEQADEVSTGELLTLAAPDVQIIDGELAGFAGTTPVILLRAVDSTSWDLEVADDELFDRLLATLPGAEEVDSDLFRPAPPP